MCGAASSSRKQLSASAATSAKGSREIGLGREIQRDGDIEEGLISAHQHLLCALETVRTDVLMRGLSDGGLEGPRKVESAQARDLRELSDCKIALEVRCDVFPHPGQSASIESPVRELLEIFVGGETAMTMHQPRCQAHRQRFGQHPATGGLGPHLRNNRERDLGNQRVLETALIAQGFRR